MIQTTLISHACLLIRAGGMTILTDPVFFDPHWEGINVLCPSVDLQKDKIPPVDILYLSHRHQDHFDVRTLSYLRRSGVLAADAVTVAPNDAVLLEVLDALDYSPVKLSEDFEPFRFKDVTLTPTPSFNREDYPEHGLLVHDGEVTVWNQVDTIVNPQVIEYIHQLHGRVEFTHSRFLPLLEGNFTFHQALKLPFEEYVSFFKVLEALAPGFVVPGSAGFRYVDRFGFLNQYSFPTTQQQFLRDLADFCPQIKSSTFFPGDVAEISKAGARVLPQSSDFVRMREDDSDLIEFKPVAPVNAIQCLTADQAEQDEEWRQVTRFIREELLDRLRRVEAGKVFAHWRVSYQLEVFGCDGSEIWSIDFSRPPEVVKGRTGKINLYEGIGCSEFYRLIRGETNWDFVGAAAQYRTFHNVYRVENGAFECYPQENKFPQPLMEIFPSDKTMDREKYMKDVRRWKDKA